MDRAHTSEHHCHCRLAPCMVALAAALALGMAAPRSFAVTGVPHRDLGESLSLRVSSGQWRAGESIKVSGKVTPVEHVGDSVTT